MPEARRGVPGLIEPRLLVIAGPTAAGKSELALAACRALGGELIAADSATVYRGLDVGTGKPSARERAEVPHHCLDLRDPREPFSVAQYGEAAGAAVAACAARGRVPVVAGGSGLYLRQLLDRPMLPPVPPDPALRAQLAARPAGELHAELAAADPAAAARLHPADRRRVIRALEVQRATGRPVSAFWAQPRPARHPCLLVLVDRPPELLRQRMAARVERMLACGLIEEVRGLLAAGVPAASQAMQALGYRQTAAWLEAGDLPLARLRDAILTATAAFAKRQRTWFRAEPHGVRIELGAAPAADALPEVLALWARTGPVQPPAPGA